ncbi:hypothetical protein E3N88_38667 [Mikania micrantha]|uniref:Uncharacterized protein n=1 Tax=Mikania micrantha TaxID=192012 RepID=A0A5N6LUX1_9ASTR|nr:hypothetical protein E3N88_38667 [Mikania micrantha]
MGLLVLIEPEIPTTRGIGRKRWAEYWSLPKTPDFFEARLRSVSGQLLELLGATCSWTQAKRSPTLSKYRPNTLSAAASPWYYLAMFVISANNHRNISSSKGSKAGHQQQ